MRSPPIERDAWPKTLTAPYAPTPAMVPYSSLGFREAVADLLWIRMLGYLGGHNDTADSVAALVIATQAADPHFKRVYTDGVRAMTSSNHDLTMAHKIRAAALAEEGMTYFPKDFDIADLAGTMYSVDLTTDDAAQKRAWREKGAMLLEKALRLPGATADDATYVAYLRSSLGQHERAVRELREMVLITNDEQSRREMIAKLAEMEQRDGNASRPRSKTRAASSRRRGRRSGPSCRRRSTCWSARGRRRTSTSTSWRPIAIWSAPRPTTSKRSTTATRRRHRSRSATAAGCGR